MEYLHYSNESPDIREEFRNNLLNACKILCPQGFNYELKQTRQSTNIGVLIGSRHFICSVFSWNVIENDILVGILDAIISNDGTFYEINSGPST